MVSLFLVGHVVYEDTRLDSFAIALHNIIKNHSKSVFDLLSEGCHCIAAGRYLARLDRFDSPFLVDFGVVAEKSEIDETTNSILL